MRQENVVSVDPGIHIGWAQQVDGVLETKMLMDHVYAYARFLHLKPDVLVIERFTVVPGGMVSKDGLATLRCEGGFEALAMALGTKIVVQYPTQRRAYLNQARTMIKDLNEPLYEHNKDALAHLLFYLSKT